MPTGFRSSVKWEIEGGTIIKQDVTAPSVTVKWNNQTSYGKIKAKDVFNSINPPNYELISLETSVNIINYNPNAPKLTISAPQNVTVNQEFSINVGLNFPDIPQRLRVTGDGLVTSGDIGTNLKGKFSTPGSKIITVSAVLNDVPYTATCSVNSNPNETISGSNRIFYANNNTYSINKNSSYTSYTWTVSSDLRIVSGQGTSSIVTTPTSSTNCSTGTISVKIQMSIGTFTFSKNIDVNKSNLTGINGPSSPYMGRFEYNYYQAILDYNLSGVTYVWEVVPSNVLLAYSSNEVRIEFLGYGTYRILCKAVSSCGSSLAFEKKVTVMKPTPPTYKVNSVQNTGILTIKKEKSSESMQSLSKTIQKEKFEIIDLATGNVKKSGNLDSDYNQINVSGVPNGNYIVRITSGERIENVKIVIRK